MPITEHFFNHCSSPVMMVKRDASEPVTAVGLHPQLLNTAFIDDREICNRSITPAEAG